MLYAVFARSESLAQAVQSPKLSLAKADSMVKALPSMWNRTVIAVTAGSPCFGIGTLLSEKLIVLVLIHQ